MIGSGLRANSSLAGGEPTRPGKVAALRKWRATGTLTTDGTLGTLTAANVVDSVLFSSTAFLTAFARAGWINRPVKSAPSLS